MITWFEKHNKISLAITILIAGVIFYVSSLTFKGTGGGGNNMNATLYHIFIFFIFSFFLSVSVIRGKRKNLFLLVNIIAIIYGILDEVHQIFVPGRSSSINDFFLDFVGILFAFMFYFILIEYRK